MYTHAMLVALMKSAVRSVSAFKTASSGLEIIATSKTLPVKTCEKL